MADAEQWTAGISSPTQTMDDGTAIKVVDGTAEVVTERILEAVALPAAASSDRHCETPAPAADTVTTSPRPCGSVANRSTVQVRHCAA